MSWLFNGSIDLTTAIKISIAFMVYYTIFQIFADFIRAGMLHNSPNVEIAKLRTKYMVNIRTFQKNNSLQGFAWFKSIWINENLFRKKNKLLFTFHHEYYHLIHHHKAKILVMRFVFSLLPLLLSFMHWSIFIILFLNFALAIHYIEQYFEKCANEYAGQKRESDNK